MSDQPNSHLPANDHHQLADHAKGGWINGIVRTFLHSNLSLILLVISVAVGAAALLITPREEDPQIVVPLADIYVNAPGMSAQQVERLVTTPLERILYQIDGVEYVYSMSRADTAIVTVRFYVGQDRERALVRLFKKLEESKDLVPPGVAGWVMKPVEIDDVPVVTLTLRARAGANPSIADEHTLRRVAEELAARLAAVKNTSRVSITGGLPRVLTTYLDREAIAGRGLALLDVQRAVQASNALVPAGDLQHSDTNIPVRAGSVVRNAADLANLVVGVSMDRPVFLRDVARIEDGPAERSTYVRHGWGPGRGFEAHHHAAGTLIGNPDAHAPHTAPAANASADFSTVPAVTIAIAKKKGTNAVNVAEDILREAERLKANVVPDEFDLVVTRNSGLIADEKVSELVEGLWVAIIIVVALLTIGLGWREALVVAVAVPVVFGLTLAVNLLAGYTINRVTLFALILSLGLLVDDPIVDVENIARHFSLRKRATRAITLEAVSEIRPPLISATLAVIASFLPLFFITGMMGPYMRPMALNVPVTMVMSMLVAFTITPWLAFHLLKNRNWAAGHGHAVADQDEYATARASIQYRLLRPLLQPLLRSRALAWSFLALVAILTGAAAMLAGFRQVPLKMLPFDNKAEILLLINADEGTPLERTDAAVRDLEAAIAAIPEVTDYTSYVGVNSPIDFNGLVRHYYLRTLPNNAEIRVNLVGKKSRHDASHTLALRERDALTAIATKAGVRLKIVELPPGPPVIDTIAAEIYGDDDLSYAALCNAAELLRDRLALEPGVVEPDDTVEAASTELAFILDQEKAALSGISVAEVAATVRAAISGIDIGIVHAPSERQPLTILARLPIADRSSPADLSRIQMRAHTQSPSADAATLVSLGEIGTWEERPVEQMIYHKNLQRVAYVFAETAGRPPADVIVDVMHDRTDDQNGDAIASNTAKHSAGGWLDPSSPRPLEGRSHLFRGGGIPWNTAPGTRVVWSGEGEWKITLDVFRDLGLAFAAALVMIYVILVAQTGSFMIPVVVMLAIPLTMVGIMPGFWLLGILTGSNVGGYADPVFFTATAMIGMIALSGIVTRQSIILVDFIHLSIQRGRPFMDAVIEAGAVRLRPILLVVAAAMLSAIPITIDPIFSGLAWALIFGLIASTIFTLFVIPLVYWMLYKNIPGHGVDMTQDN
jgi:multidrug efflux pump subunit AcrB